MTDLSQKIPNIFCCKTCDYNTSNKKDYNKHLLTGKHKKLTLGDKTVSYECTECQKKYSSRNGLWKHKKICKNAECEESEEEKIEIDAESEVDENPSKKNENELLNFLIKQNADMQNMMMELLKNGTHNNHHNNNTTNSHNKTFNLQFFLNETCKNAMNITDFMNSIQLQLSDLEEVGELGYVNGISNIIIKNLKQLDITERPIHCTDVKREILYVKDQDKWEKENDQKEKMMWFVKNVANKNIRMLVVFKNKYPDCIKSESKHSDHYNKLVIEAMGGGTKNYDETHERIIKKISKEVTIDKQSV